MTSAGLAVRARARGVDVATRAGRGRSYPPRFCRPAWAPPPEVARRRGCGAQEMVSVRRERASEVLQAFGGIGAGRARVAMTVSTQAARARACIRPRTAHPLSSPPRPATLAQPTPLHPGPTTSDQASQDSVASSASTCARKDRGRRVPPRFPLLFPPPAKCGGGGWPAGGGPATGPSCRSWPVAVPDVQRLGRAGRGGERRPGSRSHLELETPVRSPARPPASHALLFLPPPPRPANLLSTNPHAARSFDETAPGWSGGRASDAGSACAEGAKVDGLGSGCRGPRGRRGQAVGPGFDRISGAGRRRAEG